MNPYVPLAFAPTDTSHRSKVARQWAEMTGLLAQEHVRRKVRRVSFSPDVHDVREFQWAGYLAEVRYTYYLDLPLNLDQVDVSVRGHLSRATRLSYTCSRSASFEHVLTCLEQTEDRQRFSHNLEPADLRLLTRLLGPEAARCYVCYAPNGEPASSLVVLLDGEYALGWVGGTANAHLGHGASQLLLGYSLNDLHSAGATLFDYGGANIRSIASSKCNWGGHLTPYYSLAAVNFRTLAGVSVRAYMNRARDNSPARRRLGR